MPKVTQASGLAYMGSPDLHTALASCNYYPVHIDLCRRLIWFAEIDRETYRRAGFLVPKQAPMSEERYGFNLDDVLLHDLTLPIGGAPSHYIFISAFCCSTLLARLLDRVPGCFVLREPSILGQLAMMRYQPSPGLLRRPPSPRGRGEEVSEEGGAPSPTGRETDSCNLSPGDDTRREQPTVIPAEAGIQHWTPTCAGVMDAKGMTALPRSLDPASARMTGEEWESEWRTWAALAMRLVTRTFEPGQTVIVKAADVCNAMPEVILANDPHSKAILLSLGLRTFILSVLKAEDRRKWTRNRAGFWHKTLTLFPALTGVNVPELDDAQKAAYVWTVTAALWDRFREQVAQTSASQVCGSSLGTGSEGADPNTAGPRYVLMDGEEVSDNPGNALAKVASFFGLPLEESRVQDILTDPVLKHHAKFPGQSYDAATRRNDLVDWENRFGPDADRAMEWAEWVQEKLESDGVNLSSMAGAERKELEPCNV